MKLVLTHASTQKEIVIDSEQIKFFEPTDDGQGTHIVFGPDLGRVVSESVASIAKVIGVVTVPAAPQAMAAEVAKKVKKA